MQANDLRDFADNLDLAHFKALSAGIGLGAVKERVAPKQNFASQRPAERQAQPAPAFQPAPAAPPRKAARPAKAPKPGKAPQAAPISAPAAAAARPHKRPTLAFEKRLVAWALDFFFVALSLAVLLALVTVVSAVRTGGGEDVFALAPIQWLMGINPLELVAGVYGLFFAYVLLFKTVAGVTLGESLLRARLARAP